MKIVECKINHLENPMGYYMPQTVFSWKVTEAKGKKQEAARVVVYGDEQMKDVIADTGWDKDASSLATELTFSVMPYTRYYWTAAVKSDAGEEAVSEVNWFETGKMEDSWQAKWITCDKEEQRLPIFAKKLDVKKEVASARLYIIGLGMYEATIDGKRVGEEWLTPYSNDYNQWLQYQTYDVTDMLKPDSTMEVMLGNGWWKGRYGFSSKPDGGGFFSDEWKLLAEVRVTYTDGTTEVIGTDDSWNVRRGKITFSGIYDGEQMDATLEDTTPVAATLDENAPKGRLMERLSTPVFVHEELKPIELINTPAGEQVLDLGQNMAGIFKLHVNEPKGTKIHLQVGEVMQQGNFYNENLRTAKAEYIYISDGVERDIMPKFTYYGYRYVKVEGISNLKAEDFTALVLYSDLHKAGDVKTSNDLVNKLVENTRWGLKGNFLDVPTDCPQRDERMGWTGDAQVFSPTATFLEESYAFYNKYLYDCWQEQQDLDGMVPDVVPSIGAAGQSSTVWGDMACIIPWNLYKFYGDKTILVNQFDSMKAWVDFIKKVDGDNHAWREHFHYGDWLALDNPSGKKDEVKGGTDDGFIASIYYGASADLVAKAAAVLGKDAEAKEYKALSDKIFEDVKYEYYSPSGRCCINTQTAYVLTLIYNLSCDEVRTKEFLRTKFVQSDYKLQTGFTGTPLLCNVLSDHGMEDIAYKLLLNEDYPGWLHEIKLGATTVWERWNSVEDDGSISSTGMNSLNHYSYGSIVEWIFRHGIGLNPVEDVPGFKKAVIKPTPSWNLKKMEGYYNSQAGLYKSAFEVVGPKTVKVNVTVPFDCEAELELYKASPATFEDKSNAAFTNVKDGKCILTAGDYEIVYETSESLKPVFNTHMSMRALFENDEVKKMIADMTGGNMDQIPTQMLDMPFRMFNDRYAGGAMTPLLDELDRRFKEM